MVLDDFRWFEVFLDDFGCFWLVFDGLAGFGWFDWFGFCDWSRMVLASFVWFGLILDAFGWVWVATVSFGRFLVIVDGCG